MNDSSLRSVDSNFFLILLVLLFRGGKSIGRKESIFDLARANRKHSLRSVGTSTNRNIQSNNRIDFLMKIDFHAPSSFSFSSSMSSDKLSSSSSSSCERCDAAPSLPECSPTLPLPAVFERFRTGLCAFEEPKKNPNKPNYHQIPHSLATNNQYLCNKFPKQMLNRSIVQQHNPPFERTFLSLLFLIK